MEDNKQQKKAAPAASGKSQPVEVRIDLPERFTFQDRREFRAKYADSKPPASRYVVDFRRTRFIDSAGLGMLMQLQEYALKDPDRLRLVNCAPEIRQTLVVSGFDELATIV